MVWTVVVSSIVVMAIVFRAWLTWLMVQLSSCIMVVAPSIIWMLLVVSFSPCFSSVSMVLWPFNHDYLPCMMCLPQVCLSLALLFIKVLLFLTGLRLGKELSLVHPFFLKKMVIMIVTMAFFMMVGTLAGMWCLGMRLVALRGMRRLILWRPSLRRWVTLSIHIMEVWVLMSPTIMGVASM